MNIGAGSSSEWNETSSPCSRMQIARATVKVPCFLECRHELMILCEDVRFRKYRRHPHTEMGPQLPSRPSNACGASSYFGKCEVIFVHPLATTSLPAKATSNPRVYCECPST